MTTPAALGQHPLDVHEAYEALARYARDYGRAPLLLVMHAAVPETLRPDLLNLIRVNFLAAQGADPSLEADVLFAPFTTALGGGYYRIDPQVRWHALALLRSLYRHDARPRPRRIAELLWRYVEARQHQASRAADPQLAEFLDIQRWVALAFLDPTGAARAFADALQQAGHASGSVALRLGGLASAIELPLSGQPELIAYARGLDALAGGNDADAERLLGALGDGELRIGDVVLRAPTAVLAEGKGQTATADAGADAPPKRRTCLVITGFGRKTDPATGRVLDLDQSYAMIRSAVEAAGMACVRADGGEATVLGAAHLFQQILASDLVICDLSCRDGNTLYLAGVSLALRPRGILLIADDGFAEYASAAAPRLGLTYASAGDALAPDVQARFSASLRALVDGLFSAELDLPGSIFLASVRLILSASQISSESSSTISRKRQISRSPLSALTITSKFSSEPYRFLIMFRKTSSRIRIIVGRSMFFCLAKSANDSMSVEASIFSLFKRYRYKCFFNFLQ